MDSRDAVGVAYPWLDPSSLQLSSTILAAGGTAHSVPVILEQLGQLDSSSSTTDYHDTSHRLGPLSRFSLSSTSTQLRECLTDLGIVLKFQGRAPLLYLASSTQANSFSPVSR